VQCFFKAALIRLKVIDFLLANTSNSKRELTSFASTNPVALHRFDPVGPIDRI
jgi:hypothetical protein